MKKIFTKRMIAVIALILVTSLVGCGSDKSAQNDGTSNSTQAQKSSDQGEQSISDLPEGFPNEIPIYSNANIIEADHFSGNHYTILYEVNEDFNQIAEFYLNAFDLDDSDMNDGMAYYEGIDFGDVNILGLTIEEAGDAVNVYMTLEDTRQNPEVSGENTNDYYDTEAAFSENSDITTYENAQEVSLDENYPQDIVPIHPDAKVISCSLIPNTSSGFVDLILPGNDFDDAVSFYTDKLGITPKNSTTTIQEAAEFKGKINKFTVVLLISHLQSSGNDTLIQITVNED